MIADYGPLVRVIQRGPRIVVMVRDDIHPSGWTEHWSGVDAVVEADQKARALRRSILEGEYDSRPTS